MPNNASRRVQNLILEILHAQPSLRDSRVYLNTFGPKSQSGALPSSSSSSPNALAPIADAHADSSISNSRNDHAPIASRAGSAANGLKPHVPFSQTAQLLLTERQSPSPAPQCASEREALLGVHTSRPGDAAKAGKAKPKARAGSGRGSSSAWSFLEQRQRAARPFALSGSGSGSSSSVLRGMQPQNLETTQGKGTGKEVADAEQVTVHEGDPEDGTHRLQGSDVRSVQRQLDASGVRAKITTGSNDPHLRQDQQPQQQQRQEVPVPSPDAAPHSQDHVALVKIQGPFTSRQLSSIAEGMVYLKRLGLISIIVVDNEDWRPMALERKRRSLRSQRLMSQAPGMHDTPRQAPLLRSDTYQRLHNPEVSVQRFDQRGRLVVDSRELREEEEFRQWASAQRTRKAAHVLGEQQQQAPSAPPASSSTNNHSISSPLTQPKQQQNQHAMHSHESLRCRMVAQTHAIAELLCAHGAQARPFPFAMMRVDAHAAQASRAALDAVAGLAATSASTGTGNGNDNAPLDKEIAERSPLVADDGLRGLKSALVADQIPVLAPLALYEDLENGVVRTVTVSADDLLVNLAREMSLEGARSGQRGEVAKDVDLTPVRLMVINREGGIPSHARGGSPHLSINLASEYKQIRQSFTWGKTHPTALSNLSTAHACLSYIPKTSSAIVVSHRSPRSLIANLITNKAAHSPSLPHRLLAGRQDVKHTPTIIRSGLSVRVLYEFDRINWDKMTALLEASFGRRLHREKYVERVRRSLDFVIITGDYEGAAIVTKEYAPSDDPTTAEPIAYLDKFAMLPQLQGSGAVDFLWGALRDEVHGLGLLDALNDNGGKGGFGAGRDLVWKSRANNPVNRWYYERSNGFVKMDVRSAADRLRDPAPQLNWSLFWCDAEERLAAMAGEFRLGASARPEEFMDLVDEEEERLRLALGAAEEQDMTRDLSSAFSISGSRLPSPTVMAAALAAAGSSSSYPWQRDLNALRNPRRPEHGGSTLLPVVAPEEEGRIQRWAECMCTIPSAWL
ncbi:hypothetical protein K437DRAFT_254438 [Tilletiaria anomala UBC 951]|uniref:Amino-acid acetyltransferase, mitochondrial n=1 Tax=Tilletiaria anomala (strain ATCC 24038 / CBS 436.72 / UBC 951) TaxID=1037660 RepID=A0A066WI92_TILAU|nr:uncharacterized protein K437DRAFT_254438 [Tilletiaria anomala UBC 951]KDN52248.1 hypothetical protein K437DRAFT_254438 [Tilletiaria anomala UBC 951]